MENDNGNIIIEENISTSTEETKVKTITKRVSFSDESYKFIKKFAIDLEIDNDGKYTPEILGKCVEALINEKIEKTNNG